MKPSDQDHLIDLARALAQDVMELHILSFRMGTGTSLPEDYRTCQRIIAEADALARSVSTLAGSTP